MSINSVYNTKIEVLIFVRFKKIELKLSILTILLTVTTSVNSIVVDHEVENSKLSDNVTDGTGDEYSGVVIHEKRR